LKKPKHLLIELPTADEIDQLAITSPKFEVRHLSFDMGDKKADLDYTPCKGQVVLVIRGTSGVSLVRGQADKEWALPTDRIDPNEDIEKSARRVAKEACGLMVRTAELAGVYDVVWHYSNVSIKRLHIVYACLTDDTVCSPEKKSVDEARFFKDVPAATANHAIYGLALSDCSAK
jgi:ADP-ribose pyrophosphatase YjhB (NUDIX family)